MGHPLNLLRGYVRTHELTSIGVPLVQELGEKPNYVLGQVETFTPRGQGLLGGATPKGDYHNARGSREDVSQETTPSRVSATIQRARTPTST